MTSKLTREERIQSLYDLKTGKVLSQSDIESIKMLARMALAAMDSEKVRREHAEWSQGTFGNVGPVGPLKHLSKEALEAAEQPGDLSEWADMQFLLWDAQRRAGVTDEQITQAMIEKLAVNKQRSWPEPKEGEPRLHIKEQPAPVVTPVMFIDGDISTEDADKLAKVIREFNEEDERPLAKMARIIRENPHPTNECDMPKAQPAPVVPDERAAFNAWNNDVDCPLAGRDAKSAAWLAWNYRAMLQESQKSAGESNNCRSCENVQDLQAGNSPAQGGSRCSIKAAPALDSSPKTAESRCGNSPVITEGYVMVPKEPTAEMVKKMRYHVGGYDRNIKEGYKAMLAAAPQEEK